MNVNIINKPAPHCPIPEGHELYSGYIAAERTDIRRTWAKAINYQPDDYDRVQREDWLEIGGFK